MQKILKKYPITSTTRLEMAEYVVNGMTVYSVYYLSYEDNFDGGMDWFMHNPEDFVSEFLALRAFQERVNKPMELSGIPTDMPEILVDVG